MPEPVLGLVRFALARVANERLDSASAAEYYRATAERCGSSDVHLGVQFLGLAGRSSNAVLVEIE